jgi:predicted RNA binding protein YcfA (HicA-like mRNA interferase family)
MPIIGYHHNQDALRDPRPTAAPGQVRRHVFAGRARPAGFVCGVVERRALAVCIYAHGSVDLAEIGVYKYAMKSADIISALKSDGWVLVAEKGSHLQFKHPTKPGRATVPHPKKDVPLGALRSIEKQAQLKLK